MLFEVPTFGLLDLLTFLTEFDDVGFSRPIPCENLQVGQIANSREGTSRISSRIVKWRFRLTRRTLRAHRGRDSPQSPPVSLQ
jgi:hypothetical protein